MVIAALNERFTVSRETVKRSKPGHWRSRGWGICRQVLKALKYWRPKGGRRKYFLGAARPARSTRLALQDKTCLAGAGCGFCVCVKNAGILNSSAGAWGHRVHRTARRNFTAKLAANNLQGRQAASSGRVFRNIALQTFLRQT